MRYEVRYFQDDDAAAFGSTITAQENMDAVTLYDTHKGMPVACGGLVAAWPGMGYAWFLTCADPLAHKTAIARFALAQLRPRLQRFRRVEALVQEDAVVVRRFAEWLGFTVVARKPQFGAHGETFLELAWVREE